MKIYTRSFNEIPNVSAAEIAERLGLKQPELIDQALEALKNSNAITSEQADPEDEGKHLRENIEHIEFQLENDVFKGSEVKDQQLKLERLKQQLKQLEEPEETSKKGLVGFITKAINGLETLELKLLMKGKINCKEA